MGDPVSAQGFLVLIPGFLQDGFSVALLQLLLLEACIPLCGFNDCPEACIPPCGLKDYPLDSGILGEAIGSSPSSYLGFHEDPLDGQVAYGEETHKLRFRVPDAQKERVALWLSLPTLWELF